VYLPDHADLEYVCVDRKGTKFIDNKFTHMQTLNFIQTHAPRFYLAQNISL